MQKLRRFLSIIDSTNYLTGKYVSLLVIVMFSIIMLEIFLRYIFRSPTDWVYEASGYLLCIMALLGGGYALYLKAHVNVDVLVTRLSVRWGAIFNIISSLLFFTFCITLLWKGADYAWTSIIRDEHSETFWGPPVYPIKMAFPIGALLIVLQGLANLIRNVATAITGKEEL